MRGLDERTGSLFSYVDLEARVRRDHPLRVIRKIVNTALAAMDGDFALLYPTGFAGPRSRRNGCCVRCCCRPSTAFARQGNEVRPRFPDLAAIAMVEATVEQAGAVTTARRFYLSSARLTPERLAEAVRGHWAIENSCIGSSTLSSRKTSHGSEKAMAHNMAIVRHFAINAVRLAKGKRSIKTTRKLAGWDANELARLLTPPR